MNKEEKLGQLYIHIDNGGISLEAKAFYDDGEYAGAELKIENSFYGYVSNTMILHVGQNGASLNAKDFRTLANFLNEVASKLP